MLWSIQQSITHVFRVHGQFFHHCPSPITWMYFIIGPAHPHTTWVASYPASFSRTSIFLRCVFTFETLHSLLDNSSGSPALFTRVGPVEKVEMEVGRVYSRIPPCVNFLKAVWFCPKWSVKPDGNFALEKGRIHGYSSRVRVGRGRIWGHLIIWAGALRPESAKKRFSKKW